MAKLTLTARPVLGGYDTDFGRVQLREVTGMAIVSVATPLGAEGAVKNAVKSGLKADMPAPTRISSGAMGMILVSTGADQMLAIFEHATPDANALINGKLNAVAYTTDQTDSWVVLDISGPDSRQALERLCPIDLHPDTFPQSSSARTVMEHMGALIICTGPDAFRIMSASSSAVSFLHALETSIHNIS